MVRIEGMIKGQETGGVEGTSEGARSGSGGASQRGQK